MTADSAKKLSTGSQIYEYIYSEGPISRTDIASDLKLSKSTVTLHCAHLLEQNMLSEREDVSPDKVGRKPMLLEINPRYLYTLNFVIVDEANYLLISDLSKQIIDSLEFTIRMDVSYEERLRSLEERVSALLEKNEIAAGDIGLLAVSAPGFFNIEADKFYADGVFAEWRIADSAQYLADKYGWKLYFENDLNTAAWGEHCAAGKKYKDILYIGAGLGIGASLIISGELYYGCSGEAGEISNLKIWDEESASYQELYKLVSLKALMDKTVKSDNLRTQESLKKLNNGQLICKPDDIATLLKFGDTFVSAELIKMAEVLAQLISQFAALLNCERVIIGGELAKYSALFADTIAKCLKKQLGPVSCPEVSKARVDNNPTVFGTVQLSAEKLMALVKKSIR